MNDFSHLHVEFFIDKKLNKRKSAEAGTPIYDDVEKVRIRTAGDAKTMHVAPAHDQSSAYGDDNHRLTYAQLHEGPYQRFKAGQKAVVTGTPIETMPSLTPARIASLQAANVFTLEQLAGLDGAALSKLGMNARQLKDEATALLENQAKSGDNSALMAENAELRERMAALEAMIQGQQSAANPNAGKIGGVVADTISNPDDNGSDQEIEDNPFIDWDAETIKVWMKDNGGKYDARWSEDRARQEAAKLNQKIADEKDAA